MQSGICTPRLPSGAGTVLIENAVAAALGASSAGGSFQLNAGGSINTTGNLSVASLILQTPHGASIDFGGNVTVGGSALVKAQGTGSVSVAAVKTFSAGSSVLAYPSALSLGSGASLGSTGNVQVRVVSGGSGVVLEAGTYNFGPGSSVTSDRVAGEAISLVRYLQAMTINTPNGSPATLSTAGSYIQINGERLSFAPAAAEQSATLNFNGPTEIVPRTGGLSIAQGQTLASDNNMSMQVHGLAT